MNIEELKEVVQDSPDGKMVKQDKIAIPTDVFNERFNGATLTYKSLTSHEKCTPAWKMIFDDWKTKGMLN